MNLYQTYPFCPVCPWENEKERDQRKMKDLYPTLAKKIQPLIEEECDRMEYDGSFMFDEYPDKLQIQLVTRYVYDKLDRTPFEDELMMQNIGNQNWLNDLIRIMLINEMYGRRCRRRDRRCNWMY